MKFDKKKLSEIIKKSGYTSAKLSNALQEKGISISKDTIDAYRKGTIKEPPNNKLSAIAKQLNINSSAFFDDNENKLQVKQVKIIGSASCGDPVTDMYQLTDEYVYIPQEIYTNEVYALRCCGDSMSPEIEDGDIVVCLKTANIQDIQNGDIVHYRFFNENAIKVFFKDEDSYTLHLIPYNKTQKFKTKIIRLDSDEIANLQVSKVISIIKNNLNNRQARLKFAGVL